MHSFHSVSGDLAETAKTVHFHKYFTAENSVKLRYFTQLIQRRFPNLSNKNSEIQTINYLYISELLHIPKFISKRLNVF